jgi:hypothetical protein
MSIKNTPKKFHVFLINPVKRYTKKYSNVKTAFVQLQIQEKISTHSSNKTFFRLEWLYFQTCVCFFLK